tara:strand:+ start:913 stop:2751 length:1839 start_codon:yes stop_codon:yes gene_type:complete
MSAVDPADIVNTWNELQALQKETENLLVTINGRPKKDGKKKGGALASATKQLQKIVKASKGKEKNGSSKQQMAVSKSLDLSLEKTQKLYGAATPARVTVEVFDDAPSDLTPRLAFNDPSKKTAGAVHADKIREIYTAEEKFRNVDFNDERSRVHGREDVFVPGPGVTTDAVGKERERLQALEDSARKAASLHQTKIGERREFLDKDKAVLKFQAAFRGHIGRQKMSLTRRLKELAADGGEPMGEWIEVKDRETGDVWYYNTTTGESQWDKPVSMHDTMARAKILKQVPKVADKRRSASTAPLKKNRSTGFRSETEIKEKEENEKALKDVNEILGLQDLAPVDNIGMPDGKFKPQLRKTVLDAILTTRFDTVSTVMADDRWMESNESAFVKQKEINAFETSGKIDKSRQPIVAPISMLKKKKNVSKLHTDPNANEREAKLPDYENQGDLTITNIAQPGFDNTLGAENTMCFGCWSAGVRRQCALHTNPDKTMQPSQTMLLCRNWDLGVMRRRYRSEEIQEIFMKKSTSLRFDGKRKKFLTVTEHRHTIYKQLYKLLEEVNFRRILVTKARRWAYSLLDVVRAGQTKPSAGKAIGQEMRRRRTKQKGGIVRRLA